jgi:hypothetical protein
LPAGFNRSAKSKAQVLVEVFAFKADRAYQQKRLFKLFHLWRISFYHTPYHLNIFNEHLYLSKIGYDIDVFTRWEAENMPRL